MLLQFRRLVFPAIAHQVAFRFLRIHMTMDFAHRAKGNRSLVGQSIPPWRKVPFGRRCSHRNICLSLKNRTTSEGTTVRRAIRRWPNLP